MSPLQRKLRRTLGSMKDQTSIGIAKVASSGAPDLDVALVKATSHEEAPIEEKYVQVILHLTTYSRGYVSACVTGLGKRLAKTHDWVVAIKGLMLAHRILREGDSSFEQELLLSSRRGTRILYMSDFRDDSDSHGWDYSSFVRTYALFLDERLDYSLAMRSPPEGRVSNDRSSSYGNYESYNDDYGSGSGRYYEDRRRIASEESRKSIAVKDMRPSELLEKIPLIQRLIERVLACRPTGAARVNRLVQVALYPVVRESFQYYSDICDGLAIILDAFFDMEQGDCVRAFEIYTRAAKQVDELASFYGSCKNIGVCRSSEYPEVQRISEHLLETLEDFLRDRSEMSSRQIRPKSPEPRAASPAKELDVDTVNMNEILALPAPPVEEPDPVQEEPTNLQDEPDLVDFGDAAISTQEHGDRLALALFSDTGGEGVGTHNYNGGASSGERSAAGWELALMASSSELSKPNNNIMAGGFDRLLLDSMYEQAANNQKAFANNPVGSASSVALPGRPASSYLALPAPGAQVGEDPFAASFSVPPPSYVQMSDMRQKQQLLVQEQQLWYQYQCDGMQGYNGLMKFYNNGYNTPSQTVYPVPYYGASHY